MMANPGADVLLISRFPESTCLSLAPRWDSPAEAKASTDVEVQWCSDAFLISYETIEPQIRCVESDPWLVHRDSCVECFISIRGEEEYVNVESNPSGIFLLAQGKGRENRVDLCESSSAYLSLKGSHMNRGFFDTTEGGCWSMEFSIAPELFGLSEWSEKIGPLAMNIYKCGEALASPHYLSWKPIDVPNPDFHRPEFFGEARLVE